MQAPTLVISDDRLVGTTITPHLDVPHERGRSLLFCSSFLLAWKELTRRSTESIRLSGDPPLADALAASAKAMPELDRDAAVARAGSAEEGVLEAIRAELEARFGGRGARLLPARLDPGDLLAYAYLEKTLQFATPLCKDDAPRLLFRGKPVHCFGVWPEGDRAVWEARAKQIVVVDHRENDDWVIEIATSDADEQLLLAYVPPATTFRDTVLAVVDRARAKPSFLGRVMGKRSLGQEEELLVPSMDFDVTRIYRELVGRMIESPLEAPGRRLADAKQCIVFCLNEKGALLRSQAVVGPTPVPARRVRRFACTGPFLLLLLRRGAALPYFALWTEADELLQVGL